MANTQRERLSTCDVPHEILVKAEDVSVSAEAAHKENCQDGPKHAQHENDAIGDKVHGKGRHEGVCGGWHDKRAVSVISGWERERANTTMREQPVFVSDLPSVMAAFTIRYTQSDPSATSSTNEMRARCQILCMAAPSIHSPASSPQS